MAYADLILATTGLKGYWRLGDTGATLTDASLGARNGTITNATPTTGLLVGDANGALDFSPVSSRATVPHATDWSLAAGQVFSLEFLVNPGASVASITVLLTHRASDASGVQGWELYQNSNAGTVVLSRALNGVLSYSDTSLALVANTTTHVVFTFDGTNNRYYTGGVLRKTWIAGATTSMVDVSTALAIGGRSDGASRYVGVLDEVALYHAVLDQATITDHYNSSITSPGPPPQFARPASDVSAGTWTNQAGSVPLYPSIGETLASDADYIQSSNATTTADVSEVALGSLADPLSSTGHIIRYRYGKDVAAGDVVNLTVSLRQGTATEIAAWTHTDVGVGPTTVAQTLTAAQADSITTAGYSDLRLRLSAIKV